MSQTIGSLLTLDGLILTVNGSCHMAWYISGRIANAVHLFRYAYIRQDIKSDQHTLVQMNKGLQVKTIYNSFICTHYSACCSAWGKEHLIRACVHDKFHNLFLESQEEPHPASAPTSQQSVWKMSRRTRIKLCRCHNLLQEALVIREQASCIC